MVCLDGSSRTSFSTTRDVCRSLLRSSVGVGAAQKLAMFKDLAGLPSGYVQQNPWLTIANKQLELMHKYLGEFGLSPVSRSRVSLAGDGAKPGPAVNLLDC